MYNHVVQPLFTYDEHLQIVPLLAKEFPTISQEGTLYTFTLREDITFHDGSPLTTEDIAFTFQRLFDASVSGQIGVSAGSYDMIVGAKELMNGSVTGPLKGLAIIDDYTFSIEIENAFAPFIQTLGMSYVGIISKAAYLALEDKDQWGDTVLMGSGPYAFERYHKSGGVSLKANQNYWMGAYPAIERIEFTFFDNPQTALLEYEQGNLHFVDLPITQYAQYIKSDFASEIIPAPILGTHMIIVNFDLPEFQNPLVREAFAYALNRSEVVEQVYGGMLEVQDTFLPVGVPGRNSTIKAPAYDPVKARELLAQAGYPDGITVEAVFRSNNQERRQLWTLLQAYAQPAGFSILLRELNGAQHSDLRYAGDLLMHDTNWIANFPDADNLLYSFFHSSWSQFKSVNLNNAQVDNLLDTAQKSTDQELRKALYEEAELFIIGDLRAVYPISNVKEFYLSKHQLHNPVIINGITQFWGSTLSE
jgi:ABC-type transport system substrate-binding protein